VSTLFILFNVVVDPLLLCNRFFPFELDTLAAEPGALPVRKVLTVFTERREDFDCVTLRGERIGIGGGGGIGVFAPLAAEELTFSTRDVVERFFKIGFRSCVFCGTM
jgi:hypothetical protein